MVNIKGNILNRVGVPNSVFIKISCWGLINILLSIKNPLPIPINMSLVI